MLNIPAAHHAHSGIDGIVNRVEVDVAVSASKFNFDNYQVVDMVQVVTNVLLGVSPVIPTNDQVATRTRSNLASNMAGHDELTFAPLDLDLFHS